MKNKLKNFEVSVRSKYPPVGEQPAVYEITAFSRSMALRQARNKIYDAGHTRQDGPLIFGIRIIN